MVLSKSTHQIVSFTPPLLFVRTLSLSFAKRSGHHTRTNSFMKKQAFYVFILCVSLNSCADPGSDNSTINQNKTVMKTNDFSSTVLVDKSPKEAFKAIQNFRAWWSEQIKGPTDSLNEAFFYHYKDIHLCKIKLVERIPNKKIVYQVLENQFNFVKDQSEWVNTKLIFELSEEGNKTKITFTHEGLVPSYECYKVCNDAWTGYIQNSLFKLITTGKGEPNPSEGEGFNAKLAEKWKLK